jgi:hypothetical protein
MSRRLDEEHADETKLICVGVTAINYPTASGRGIRRVPIGDPHAISKYSFPMTLYMYSLTLPYYAASGRE